MLAVASAGCGGISTARSGGGRGDRGTVSSKSAGEGISVTGVTADRLVQRVLAAARPGAIVLLHDGGGNRSATVAALPAIIDGLHRLGLTLTALPA
jgi:peptidoglycan/xylan/chitin deacetylase (PgdA/CDA1 family)